MPFEELEHTADVKMRITAPDFLSLLAESGDAMASVLYGDFAKEPETLLLTASPLVWSTQQAKLTRLKVRTECSEAVCLAKVTQ